MSENKHDQTLSFLVTMFPDIREKIIECYGQDPLFREIAADYMECSDQQEAILRRTGRRSEIFADTIRELKEELDSCLAKIATQEP